MKNLIFTPIFMAVIFTGIAQEKNYLPYYNNGEPWQFQEFNRSTNDKTQDSLIQLHEIATRKEFKIDKQGRKNLYSITTFDSNQNEFSLWDLDKKRIKHKSQLATNGHRVFHWKDWGAPKQQFNSYSSIDGKNYLTEKIVVKRQHIESRTNYFYAKNGQIDSTHWFGKNDGQPTKVTHYLHKNGKLTETKTYEHGKLKTVRKYDCEPLGEVEKKLKTSQSCKNTEFDKEGNRIEISENTNSKGQISIFKTTYVGNSDKVYRYEGFDNKQRTTYFTEITDTSKRIKFYRKPGKMSSEAIEKYENGKLVRREYLKKGKVTNQRVYSYNEEGQEISETLRSGKKLKLNYSVSYEYNELGLIGKKTWKTDKKTIITFHEYN